MMVCGPLAACGAVEPETSGTAQAGTVLQGSTLQGSTLQGMRMQGFRVEGATLDGLALDTLRVERGELVAEQGGATLRGTALAGAQLAGEVRSLGPAPVVTSTVSYRITAVEPEAAAYDPTQTGSTFLYTLEQWVDEAGAWVPACPADADGRRAAIPLAATWDERGDRLESSSLFTFGCTTGVLAKCYRWGYRPWVTGYGDLAAMHWTCTRLARADYCGDGRSHTQEGTRINIWDTLPAPGPIQKHGLLPPLGMLFEAGWGTHGAVCLSHARWLTLGDLLPGLCPDRLIPPGLGGIACDSVLDALARDPAVKMFNESYLLLDL
ncbi:MAG TPA: ADYC domain-containing protein [Kofleriaceae bacterium]|nr:ADYC domain-containing protein [Kofleriaceae bacterium]